MRTLKHKVLLSAFLLVSTSFAMPSEAGVETRWVDLPAIKTFSGMQVRWVAKKMRYNGLPMTMQTFQANRSAEDVLNKYEDYWKAKVGAFPVRSKNGIADVIGVERGRYYYSVQVAPEGKRASSGTLSVSLSPKELEKSKLKRTEFLLPRETNALVRIEALDEGVESETLTFHTNRDIDSSVRWYETRMREDGWALLQKTQEHGTQLLFQKASQHAMINLVDQRSSFGDTAVQINWVKN